MDRGEWARCLVRRLRPWVDPGTRRPLVLLAVVSLGIFLAPLALDVARAAFFGLPKVVRQRLGEGATLALLAAGLWRLATVRPADAWPTPRGPARRSAADRWLPWALRLAVASLAIPLLRHPDGLGFGDWDFYLEKFEAARRTIADHGQFPWWNPWSRGGFPLAGDPQAGVVSIATPPVLWLGTKQGLALTTAFYLVLAVEGAYRLARLWLGEPWSAAAAALIFGLNGGVVLGTVWGYYIPMSYVLVPWLAYHAFRIGDRLADGLALGGWLGFGMLVGVHYLTIYAGLLASVIGLRALLVHPPGGRARVVLHGVAALGAFLAVGGWRVGTVLSVLRDDIRELPSGIVVSPAAAVHYLLHRPRPDWPAVLPERLWGYHIETTSYVGPLVLVLLIASLRGGWRWWHTLALLCGWLALGGQRWYHLSYWTSGWPLLSMTQFVIRWRLVAMLGVGLAVGSLLASWRRSGSRLARLGAISVVAVIAADFLHFSHQQLPIAFSVPPDAEPIPGPPVPDIAYVRSGKGYPLILRGYGVVEGYQPMLGYRRDAPTARLWRGHPDYRGEAWTEAGPVAPDSWSPNRLVFRVAPYETVFINQNPGSWWLVNGDRRFAGLRCAVMTEPFAARADGGGVLDLRIRPPGLGVAVGLHAVGAALILASWATRRALRGRIIGEPGPAGPLEAG